MNGRPLSLGGKFDEKYSLRIVAERMAEILNRSVHFEEIPLDQKSPEYTNDITVHENTRFLVGEKSGDENLARKITKNCDVFVMDAFGASHRKHCSTYTLSKFAPVTCGGLLIIEEIKNLKKIFENPKKPMIAVIGGSKVSTKLTVLKELLNKVDVIIVGGGIANTFLKSSGFVIGQSLFEESMINKAKEIIKIANKKKVSLPLPDDVVCENKMSTSVKELIKIDNEDIIKDIGPKTSRKYEKLFQEAGTILWNGPVGVFEKKPFENGTKDIASAICKSNAFTIAGGGDTISALEKFANISSINYVSTGGGAFLQFLEGKELPGIEIIKKL